MGPPNEGKDYKWYISGICPANWGLHATYHLLWEPKTTIDYRGEKNPVKPIFTLRNNRGILTPSENPCSIEHQGIFGLQKKELVHLLRAFPKAEASSIRSIG